MRLFLTVLIACCVAALCIGDRPARYRAWREAVSSAMDRWLYQRELLINGLHVVDAAEVEKLLPEEHSNLWWVFSTALLQTELLSHPLIQQAEVHRCRALSFACFVIDIVERQAGFFLTMGNQGWLAGEDGGVIMPLSVREIEAYLNAPPGAALEAVPAAKKRRIPVVRGLWQTGQASSDVVRSRFEEARRAIAVIEQGAGRQVTYLELGAGPDLRARFAGLDLTATFEVSREDLWNSPSPLLSERAERLKQLLDEVGDRSRDIASVDLGFEKIAVVRMKNAN